MNYGLYLSASGLQVNMARQDVFANNMANVKTGGFKPDMAMVMGRRPEVEEKGLGFELRHELLDRLGGGVFKAPHRLDMSEGPMEQTDNPLDVALANPKTFLNVQATNPQTGQPQLRLTRDGALTLNAEGQLITQAGGHRVLDDNDQPITVDREQDVNINEVGAVIQSGEVIAQLGVSQVTDDTALRKDARNLLRIEGGDELRQPADDRSMRPGYRESSGVDPIKTLNQLIAATNNVSANGNMIRYHDQMMEQAVNTLGRVA